MAKIKIKFKFGLRATVHLKKGKPAARSGNSPRAAATRVAPLAHSNAGFPQLARSVYRPRRAAAGGIDFYDPGLLKQTDGSFRERSFEALLSWHGVSVPGAPDPVNVYDKMTTADWVNYKNFLLNPPRGMQLTEAYKKFDYETSDFYYVDVETYQTGDTNFETLPVAKNGSLRKQLYKYSPQEVNVTTDNWTADKGLRLSNKKPHLRVKSYAYYEEFDTGDTVNFKVTTGLLFTDAPVSFNVAKSHCDIFLVPRLFLEVGNSKDFAAVTGGGEARFAYANLLFVQLPRFFKDPPVYHGAWADYGLYFEPNGFPVETPPDFATGYFPFAVGYLDPSVIRLRNALTDIIYGRANKRMIKSQSSSIEGVNTSSGPTVAPLSDWASYLAARSTPSYARYNRTYNLIQNPNMLGFDVYGIQTENVKLSVPQTGSLVAVIDQGNTRYYVWAKRENPGYHLTRGLQRSFELAEDRIPAIGGATSDYHQWNLR